MCVPTHARYRSFPIYVLVCESIVSMHAVGAKMSSLSTVRVDICTSCEPVRVSGVVIG